MKPEPSANPSGVNANVGGCSRDAFLGGAVVLLQPKTGYRAGADAVLLAASLNPLHSVRAGLPPLRVGDFGAGVGTVGLCLATRCRAIHIDLIERDPGLAQLARDNCQENTVRAQLAGRITVVETDITGPAVYQDLPGNTYDHVLANPPYYVTGTVRRPRNAQRCASNVFAEGDIAKWVSTMSRTLKPSGSATVINVASKLDELLAALSPTFGRITVVPIHARAFEPAKRVLVRAHKGARGDLTIAPPLVLHDRIGRAYSPGVRAVLMAPEPLRIWPG
ncbi:MAG: methyltransferase [Pseudomonadota bacterium]